MEQEEYTKEAIDWSYIEFVDNQDVLDLIEKVNSILCLFFFLEFSPVLMYVISNLTLERVTIKKNIIFCLKVMY